MPRPMGFIHLANHSTISGSTSRPSLQHLRFCVWPRCEQVLGGVCLQRRVAMASTSTSAAIAVPNIVARRSASQKDSLSSISSAWPPSRNLSLFSPLSVTSPVNGRKFRIVSMATGDTSDPSKAMQDALKYVQDAWEKTDDKLAVGGLGFAALIGLWASAGLIGAIDKLPLIPNIFEFVGILFTGWFIYRYLLFKPDREDLVKKLENAVGKITGKEGY